MKTTILLWFMLQLVLSEALSPKIMQIVQQKLGNNIIIICIIKLLHLSIKSSLLNFYIQTTPIGNRRKCCSIEAMIFIQ